jgi:DNA topoisomerase-1
MAKNLVIVESPTKAKTLSKFLSKDYEIKSSYGHIRDLPKKGGVGVDVKKGFAPTYEVAPDKLAIVKELKKEAKGKTVWLASDEDREGEAIAWHIAHVLGLDPKKTKRIVFHEITERAILAAIEKPRTIDMKLVDAQQARRILDRLVGYELSPVLWKKVRAGLSAGRVQSVAVRLIVEREREIKDFKPESSFKLTAIFKAGKAELEAELIGKLATQEKAKDFLQDANKAKYTIKAIEQKPGKRSPGAPFTTSTLQQEAARKLGYGVRQTMTLAQRLYEHGHITYMRTDSMNLSQLAIDAAKKFIVDKYGEKYLETRQYHTKSKGAQEAHEAIRPTHMGTLSAGADAQQKKLYELIWKRTVASQMAAAAVEKTEITIIMSNRKEQLKAVGEILTFDGYLKVYGGGRDDRILPEVKVGQELDLVSMDALQNFTKPSGRYSEASLVRKLEELGIGRPSTYAPTIGTIQSREYVEKKDLEGEQRELQELTLEKGKIEEKTQTVTVGADRSKLVPTPLAEIVTDFLMKYFGEVMDYDFTADVEKELDASRAEASQQRKLGKDPKTGDIVYARFGRFGPMLQLGEAPDRKDKEAPKPKFAPMPAEATLESVTLEQALPMFNLPRVVGATGKGEEIIADIGRFGPYVKVGKMFVSIKDQDPLKITEAEARAAIAAKEKKERERVIATWDKIQILNGPYGPYVTDGKNNARVPKDEDPKKITESKAKKMLEEAKKNPPKRFGKRRFPAKK